MIDKFSTDVVAKVKDNTIMEKGRGGFETPRGGARAVSFRRAFEGKA